MSEKQQENLKRVLWWTMNHNLIPVSLSLSLSLSLTCLFMLLPHFLTLSAHHSHHPQLPLSFTPGSRVTYLFHKSFPPQTHFRPQDWFHGLYDRTISSEHLGFCFYFLHYSFWFVPCGRLSLLFASFWAHVNILYRIVSCRNNVVYVGTFDHYFATNIYCWAGFEIFLK